MNIFVLLEGFFALHSRDTEQKKTKSKAKRTFFSQLKKIK